MDHEQAQAILILIGGTLSLVIVLAALIWGCNDEKRDRRARR